jgi:hypothetical protein
MKKVMKLKIVIVSMGLHLAFWLNFLPNLLMLLFSSQ